MFLNKTIYLVRHGETILNAEHKRQGREGKLSEKGVAQVSATAARLIDFKISKIFSSPYERTIETTQIIRSIIDPTNTLSLEYSELLTERRNPSSIIGLSYDDTHTVYAINFMDKSYHPDDARFEDEENFNDLKQRALELQKFLASNAPDHSLCVTHGIFLKMFLSVCIYGEALTMAEYIKLSVFNPAENAGLSVIEYSPIKSITGNGWKVLAYNDSSSEVSGASI